MSEPVLPPRMARLARDGVGRPIPWFVAEVSPGVFDPRVASAAKRVQALRFGNCWVCGQITGRLKSYVIGPMCAVNRVTAEPGCHRDCAVYSATACPFLSVPNMRRRTTGLPTPEDGRVAPPGEMVLRNPGVCLVWTTARTVLFSSETGPLIRLGDPVELQWFARGRPASPEQVRESIESGLPALYAAADQDDDPVASRAALDREIAATYKLLPA